MCRIDDLPERSLKLILSRIGTRSDIRNYFGKTRSEICRRLRITWRWVVQIIQCSLPLNEGQHRLHKSFGFTCVQWHWSQTIVSQLSVDSWSCYFSISGELPLLTHSYLCTCRRRCKECRDTTRHNSTCSGRIILRRDSGWRDCTQLETEQKEISDSHPRGERVQKIELSSWRTARSPVYVASFLFDDQMQRNLFILGPPALGNLGPGGLLSSRVCEGQLPLPPLLCMVKDGVLVGSMQC